MTKPFFDINKLSLMKSLVFCYNRKKNQAWMPVEGVDIGEVVTDDKLW